MAEVSERAEELLRPVGDLWWLADALNWSQLAKVSLGCRNEVVDIGKELEPLATRVGHVGAVRNTLVCRYQLALLDADLNGVEKSATRCLEETRRAGFPWFYLDQALLGQVALWRGRFDQAAEWLELSAKADPRVSAFGGWANPIFFLVRAYAGDTKALVLLNEVTLPRPGEVSTYGVVASLLRVVEGLAVLGEGKRVAELYPLVREAIEIQGVDGVVMTEGAPLPQKAAGIAASQGKQWEIAERHFQTALRHAHEMPHKMEQPEVRRWYAKMLIDRDAPGDGDKARKLLKEAIEAYREIGMPKHIEMAEEMLKSL
jgi:tetratricopeptide (TPR) repeat protein